jgi:hypothetical protein
VIAAPLAPERDRRYGRLYPLYGAGVVRGDVVRVTLDVDRLQHIVLYDRGSRLAAETQSWGTFGLEFAFPRAWHGSLRFYGARGLLATLPLASARPRARVVAVG